MTGMPANAPKRALALQAPPCFTARVWAIGVTMALTLALAWMSPAWANHPAPPGVLHLTQAVVAPGPDSPVTAASPRLRLPTLGEALPLNAEGRVWLQLRFDLPAAAAHADGKPALMALHLPLSCGWIDIKLNGETVHREPHDPTRSTSRCPRPRLVTLPSALLQPLDNLIELRLSGRPLEQVTSIRHAAGLSEAWVGPHDVLAEHHARQVFWQGTLVQVVDLMLVMLGLFMLVLAVANRRGPHLAFFGLAALGWAVYISPAWWTAVPLAPAHVDLLLAVLPAPIAAFSIQFLLRFVERPIGRLRWALVAQCVALPLSLLMAPAEHHFSVAMAWTVALTAELSLAMLVYLRSCWHRRPGDAWVMLAILAAGGLAWSLEAWYRPDGLEGGHALAWIAASPFGWSAFLLAAGCRLLYLFNKALVAAEATRLSLETRVRDITAEIERNFAQLSELRVEQVAEKERKRIAADLHDDLGAKLLTIVHTCDNERIATLAREALDEMRLSVRGLSGRPMRLADAMADWRAETVQRLSQTNIQVSWDSPNDDVVRLLPARAFVQTTRILREAVNNIIKHSGASRCEVRCFATDSEYGLVVADNGRGIALSADGGLDRGHGMASMKHRAKQLDGQCLVETGIGLGTVIRLTLPL